MQTCCRFWLIVFSIGCLPVAGCVHPRLLLDEGVRFTEELRLKDNHAVVRGPRFVLPSARSIYVAESLPSATGKSVSRLAMQTSATLTEFYPRVSTGDAPETLDAALRSASKHAADYLVYPQIVVWDGDVGSWSDLVSWLKRRDPSIQGDAPDSATGTARIRAAQLDNKAAEQARLNRDQYFAWRDQNATSDVERAELAALRAGEERDLLKNRLRGGTRDAMQWIHERATASANWVRSRDLEALGRDQVGVRLTLVEARSGEFIETAILRGQSGLLTFLGDRPDELIDGALRAYARALSGQSDPNTYAFQRIPF